MQVLNYKEVKRRFEENCKHLDAYKDEDIAFNWGRCKDCDLSNDLFHDSQWRLPEFHIDSNKDTGTAKKTLCFAIWHDDCLGDRILHIHTDETWNGWMTILVHKGIAYMPLNEVQNLVRNKQ